MTLSLKKALVAGWLSLTIPTLMMLVVPSALLLWLVDEPSLALGLAIPIGSLALAWLWWALFAPRWRLWAYRRVDNVLELKFQAENQRLVWPTASPLSRTEIKSRQHEALEHHLELECLAERGAFLVPPEPVETAEQKAKATYFILLPMCVALIFMGVQERRGGTIDPRTNGLLLALAAILFLQPIVDRSRGAYGWPIILTPLPILVGLGALTVVDYGRLTIWHFAIPCLLAVLGAALVDDLRKRARRHDEEHSG